MRAMRNHCGVLLPVAMMFIFNSCSSYRMTTRSISEAHPAPDEVVLAFWGDREFKLFLPEVRDEVLQIALDHWDEGRHNRFRGRDDAFAWAPAAALNARQAGLRARGCTGIALAPAQLGVLQLRP